METEVRIIAEKALARAKNILNVDDVSLEVRENPEKVIPETGVGGFTPDSHTIFVYYDSNNENFKKNLESEIRSTVTHEFHHTVRNRAFNWEEDTLLGAMVTEGLADYFDIEVNGGKPKPWSVALSELDLEKLRDGHSRI